MGSRLARLLARGDRAARGFGDWNHRWLSALFRPLRPVRDILNGRWLGHPLHPAITDVPIGAFVVALILDLVGQPDGAVWAVIVGQASFAAAAITGLADYSDADGTTRARATVHGTVMVVGGALTLASLAVRLGGATTDVVAIVLLVAGLLVIGAGAYVGGDLVFRLGSMVDRHAFRGAGGKWVRLDTGEVADLGTLPERSPRRMRAGANDLVIVRDGATIHALHAVCAHAGGPLDQGTIVDGCIECPWHGARYRLDDGAVRRGPSVYDQPRYEVRAAEGGGYEVRRAAS